ncbi:MAG: hypothetical protein ACRDOU_17025 [Streptosporangiaceae bacterium]
MKMVVQLLILPAGFGRFFPRWQMVQEEDLHSRVGVRERSAASDRGAELTSGSPGNGHFRLVAVTGQR